LEVAHTRLQAQVQEIQRKNAELIDLYRELETSFVEVIKLLTNLLELRGPEAAGHAHRVAEAARAVAERLGVSETEQRDIEIAATLHDLGKIGLPETLLTKPSVMMTRDELTMFRQYPILGQVTLQSFRRLQPAAILVRHHRERFNGTGFPDHLAGEAIPLGARIIAVTDEYDETRDLTLITHGRGSRYDPRVVERFLEYVRAQAAPARPQGERRIAPVELREEMVLARDLYTRRGLLLATRGKVLDAAIIEKIRNFDRVDSLATPIYIRGG